MQRIAMFESVLENAGEYLCQGEFAAAIDALGSEWPGIGVFPLQNGHDDIAYARLLLICGVLTMKLGIMSLSRFGDASREMLGKSEVLFGGHPEAQAARMWSGVSYLDEGRYNEAIAWADTILAENTANLDVTFSATLTRAFAETFLGNPKQGLGSLDSISSLVDEVKPLVRGKYYLQYGVCCRRLGRVDEALEIYDRAVENFELANSRRYSAQVMNNIAYAYMHQGITKRARVFAKKALVRIQALGDKFFEAEIHDTIAQIYIAEQNFPPAVESAQCSVDLLSESEKDGKLAEALITLGRASAGLSASIAMPALRRAEEIALSLGNSNNAKEARTEMWKLVSQAKEASRQLAEAIEPLESLVINHALESHNGGLTATAKELGLPHQILASRIRALGLTGKRQKPVKRKRSIMRSTLQDN